MADEDDETDAAVLPDVAITGTAHINKCEPASTKSPSALAALSCLATYTGIFDKIRALFARESGMDAGLFTVNSKGGCRVCKGDGVIHYHVGMGNFIDLECEPRRHRFYRGSHVGHAGRQKHPGDSGNEREHKQLIISVTRINLL